MSAELPVRFRSRRLLWIVVVVVSLGGSALMFASILGDGVRLVESPAILIAAAVLALGVYITHSIALPFLMVRYALELTHEGIRGVAQTNAFSAPSRPFQIHWSDIDGIETADRWGGIHAAIVPVSGEPVMINPLHLSGYGIQDGEKVVRMIMEASPVDLT